MAHRITATTGMRSVLLGFVALLLLALPATAQDDEDVAALGLEVTAGFDGQGVPGTWLPVEVRLAPQAPFAGRIIMASNHQSGRVLDSRDVEVGAGVEKVYRFLAAPTANVQVQVVEHGADDGVTVRPRLDRGDGFLVGLLGVDPATAPAVTSPVTQQRAIYVTVDERVLELGPAALGSLSAVVVDGATLAGLDDASLGVLAAATAAGGQLVVTGPSSADLGLPWSPIVSVGADGLEAAPAAWAASAAELAPPADEADAGEAAPTLAATRAGRGRLLVSTVALGGPGPGSDARYWEHVLQPGVLGQPDTQPSMLDRLNEDLHQTFMSAIGDLPSIGLLAVFLAVYVVVVGPVTAAVLSRRRRKELAWVVIPVVTAVFAAAGFVGAAGSRPSMGSSGRAAYWINDLGTTVTAASVRSPQAGVHTVALPGDDWRVLGAGWDTDTRLRQDGDDTQVDLTLGPQSPGLLVGWQTLEQPAPLAVETAVVGGELHLEITNRTAGPLSNVEILTATNLESVADTIAAGETIVETLALPSELPVQGDPHAGPFNPFRPFQMRQEDPGPRSMATLLRWDVLAGHPGMFWVTAEADSDLGLGTPTIDGRPASDRGTFVAVGAAPAPTDDATHPFEVQRDLLLPGGGFDLWREGPLRISGSGEVFLRLRLPHEGAIESLEMQLDRGGFNGVFRGEPAPMPTFEGELPECPPDAVSCVFNGDTMEVCFGDGTCEVHGVAQPLPEPAPPPPDVIEPMPGGALQLWDHREARWVDLAEGAGIGPTTDLDRFLSPLGEVWMRATGELFPFDTSGRSVSATLGGGA